MTSIDLGVTITLGSYLVIVTSFIMSMRKDLNTLQSNFNTFKDEFDVLNELKEDFIRFETKIELLLKLPREEK